MQLTLDETTSETKARRTLTARVPMVWGMKGNKGKLPHALSEYIYNKLVEHYDAHPNEDWCSRKVYDELIPWCEGGKLIYRFHKNCEKCGDQFSCMSIVEKGTLVKQAASKCVKCLNEEQNT